MATILLSAAGAAVGAGFGGTVLGLSGAVIGRAIGATLGQVIDQRLLGSGARAVETGRVDRFRLTGASEGSAVARIWGSMRLGGQVIWASRFTENQTTSGGGGGKGAPKQPSVTSYSYSVSLALALCEGEITRVGRIWADGSEIARDSLNLRVYTGTEDQEPDPKIEAVEGEGMAPAYRGIAYVVIEDLDLERFGNRVPQFSFEVVRRAQGPGIEAAPDLSRAVEAVAMIPGTGEYSLATTPVAYDFDLGEKILLNVNTPSGKTDFPTAIEVLGEELPLCHSVSLVVSWFGDDLRAGHCRVMPKVEHLDVDGDAMPWRVSNLPRDDAEAVGLLDDRPVYGGTPADASVIEAIATLNAAGQKVVFYPFILMEQMAGNDLPDPWNGGAPGQAVLPWRGRITTEIAPGQPGTTDGTAAAVAEVAAFFGAAQPEHFTPGNGTVLYSGPPEWSKRRFILHYAHLCAMAGGVDAFCIGSEMVALTQIRGPGSSFPAVTQLRQLAQEVRAILGPDTKISYAADWSEYFGYHPGNGDAFFHLDPLWADPAIDFIGIDNYMPLSDWRDGEEHLDAHWGAIWNLDYLMSNIEGGEGYDWYYAAPEHRDAQIRTPITDGAHDEPWVWRYKDMRGWWENAHYNRIGGVRQASPTAWEPQSKPFWFTELGCAAVDKGTNQPNKFVDPKSSESSLPHFSDGRRDDLIQMQYLRAMAVYWADPAHNPLSEVDGQAMLDTSRGHVWAWDARPYPYFPNNEVLWSDGENHPRGHWLTGRATTQPLGSVVAEICHAAGLTEIDVSGLYGLVRGYGLAGGETARAALQPLMLAYGFEAAERGGRLVFRMRDGRVTEDLTPEHLALGDAGRFETMRAPEAEVAGRVRLAHIEAGGDYEIRAAEAVFPDEAARAAAASEMNLALTRSEAQRIVERWLAEARVARDGARFALPPSLGHLGAGDVVRIDMSEGGEGPRRYRIDRAEMAGRVEIEAVRVETGVYQPSDEAETRVIPRSFVAPVTVFPLFLDLPLMRGSEVAHAPHLAVTATPWPGSIAVYDAPEDQGYELNRLLPARAVVGRTQTPLFAARPGLWDRGAPLRIRISGGALASASAARVLDGSNVMAIGDGSAGNWELIQFAKAELVSPDVWEISERLRGQQGTDALMPVDWPTGSLVVLMNGAPGQIELAPAMRGLARHYRIGSSQRGYDDPSYVHRVEAFEGVGLRPYAPCHLRAARDGGARVLSWIRRTRIEGDGWTGLDVPLGEGSEAYLLRVVEAGAIRREVMLAAPLWTHTAAMRAEDVAGPYEIHVAQLSETFGPGPFARIVIND